MCFVMLFGLLSCGKSDEVSLRNIGSIPVSDAAYIFKREGTRSDSDEEGRGVWKVTFQGDEVKLQVLDNEGNVTDIEIISVESLSNNYLIARTTVGDVLVDKKTNKVYKCPYNLYGGGKTRVEEYSPGTLYYSDYDGKIYKAHISTQSVEEEEILPDGQQGLDFFLGQNGTIYYAPIDCYDTNGKVMTRNKYLYPVSEFVDEYNEIMFASSDRNIYSTKSVRISDYVDNYVDNIDIYKWTNMPDGKIEPKLICSIPNRYGRTGIDLIQFAPINTVSGNVVLFLKYHVPNGPAVCVYEFDGEKCVLKRTYNTEEELKLFEKFIDNAEGCYRYMREYKTIGPNDVFFDRYDGAGGYQDIAIIVDLISYDLKSIPYEIPKNEYEIYNKKTNAKDGKLLFNALRYSDGSIVLGEVDGKGEVKILSERKSTYNITSYFALN